MIIQSSDPIVHITYGDIPSQMSNDTDDNHRYLWLFHTYFFIFKAVLQIVQGSPTLTILKKKKTCPTSKLFSQYSSQSNLWLMQICISLLSLLMIISFVKLLDWKI